MRDYRIRIQIEGLGPGPAEHTELLLGSVPAESIKEVVDRAKELKLAKPAEKAEAPKDE